MLANRLISSHAKKQPVLALSAEESEFIALVSGLKGISWLKKFKKFFKEILTEAEAHKMFSISIGEGNSG